MATWIGVGVIIAVLAAILLAACIAESRRLRRVRERFTAGRRRMSSQEFFECVSDDADNLSLLVAARRAMAQLCEVDDELIHPSDEMQTLWWLQFDGGDLVGFVSLLGRNSRMKLDCQTLLQTLEQAQPCAVSFGDFAKKVVAACRRVGSATREPHRPDGA